jgi:hypothetical protein
MQNIKYVVVTSTIENLILNPTAAPYLSLMVGSLLFACKLRKLISGLLFKSHLTPIILTTEFLAQFDGVDLYTPDFLIKLRPDLINPFTQPVLVQLHAEFALENQNPLDAGLDIVVGLFLQLEMFYSPSWNY